MADLVLFLSAHLDDVVLSCPGHVLAARAGADVVVATLFSEGGPDHARRRADDARACAALGARPLHLGLRDAPWRRGHPPSFRALVLDALERDAEDFAEARRAVAALVASLRPALVYAPLAVGEHVDHRALFEAAPRHARFYEDQPYALARGAIEARLGLPLDRDAYRAALERAPTTAAWLPPGPERTQALDALAHLARPPSSLRVVDRLALDAAAIAAARAAQACYGPELDALGVAALLPAQVEVIRA